jgi:hypothetical protein
LVQPLLTASRTTSNRAIASPSIIVS